MANVELRKALRKSRQPVFVSASAEDLANGVTLHLFSAAGNIPVVAFAKEEKAYSPFDGSLMEHRSIGEIAAEASDLAELVVVGHCKKNGLDLLTSPEIASALKEGSTIYCVASGEPVTVEKAESEDENEELESPEMEYEEFDGSEDEPEDEPEDEESEEEESEDDDSDEDAPEDVGEESASVNDILAALELEISSSDDEEDEEDESEDDEEEGEDEPEEDESDGDAPEDDDPGLALGSTTIRHSMPSLVTDLSTASVVFLNKGTALLMASTGEGKDAVQVGTFSAERLSEENAKSRIMDKADLFGAAVTRVLSKSTPNNLATDLAGLGFAPVTVELPFTVAQEQLVKAAIESATAGVEKSVSDRVKDISSNYHKLVALASVGLNKNVLEGHSLLNDLSKLLETAGVRTPGKVARKFVEESFSKFMASAIENASTLAIKEPSYVGGISAAVEKASYPEIESAKADLDRISTSVLSDRVVIASGYPVNSQREPSRVKSVMARMGRGR